MSGRKGVGQGVGANVGGTNGFVGGGGGRGIAAYFGELDSIDEGVRTSFVVAIDVSLEFTEKGG